MDGLMNGVATLGQEKSGYVILGFSFLSFRTVFFCDENYITSHLCQTSTYSSTPLPSPKANKLLPKEAKSDFTAIITIPKTSSVRSGFRSMTKNSVCLFLETCLRDPDDINYRSLLIFNTAKRAISSHHISVLTNKLVELSRQYQTCMKSDTCILDIDRGVGP